MTDIASEPAGKKTPQESTESSPVKKPFMSRTAKAIALAGIFAASAAAPGFIGAPARGVGAAVSDTAGMVYMMHKGDEMYLSDPHMVDARSNTWTVKAVPYSNADYNKDGVLFTVKGGLLNSAWAKANGPDGFIPDKVVGSVGAGQAHYKVTYHGTLTSLFESGPRDAVLLDVQALPPDPPKVARSGIPFAWPPGTWDKAFTPF